MAKTYFRITAYYPNANIGFIVDSNGKFEELWQFSAFLVKKGCKILHVGRDEKFQDGNIPKIEPCEELVLRACQNGKPEPVNGVIDINGRRYTPN